MPARSLTWWILAIGGVAIVIASLLALTVVVAVLRSTPAVTNQPQLSLNEMRLPRPAPIHNDYVGSQVCHECHGDIFGKYQTHPMAHSAGAIDRVDVIEEYARSDVAMGGGRTYHATQENGVVTHHETLLDANDEQVYQLSVPISVEVGSGKRGRSYLVNRDGFLYQSPLTWYSAHQKWGMSPGYTLGSNPRFSRRILDGCVQCHIGRINRDAGMKDAYKEPILLEASIGCERCHGPAGRHVEYRRDSAMRTSSSRDPIINPAKLDAPRRESICNQCHLQGMDRVVRYGQSDFDFRPGQMLNDVWVSFVEGTGVEERGTKAVSQVEQMRASRCYQKAQGELGCASCHDPHGVPKENERESHFRDRCMSCHDDEADCRMPIASRKQVTATDSCIDCHMPKLAATDVPHTSQTDHRIPRTPHKTIRIDATSIDGPQPFDDGGGELPELVLQRARGILLAKKAERERDPALANSCLSLLLPLVHANPDDIAALEAVGACYWVLGAYQQAERYWDAALLTKPDIERVLSSLALICQESKALDGALTYLDDLIAANPTRADLYGRRAHILGQLGRFDEGIEAAKRSLDMDPSLAQVHGWLAEVYASRGEDKLSEKHRTMLYRLLRTREK